MKSRMLGGNQVDPLYIHIGERPCIPESGACRLRAYSNCVQSQEVLWVFFRVTSYQGKRCLRMELRVTSNFRMQAVRATFFGLPAASSRW